MVLELLASPEVLSPQLFEHFAELAAASWQKAAELWQASAQLPFRFDSVRSPEKSRWRWRRTAMGSADARPSEDRGSRVPEVAAPSVTASENEVLLDRGMFP